MKGFRIAGNLARPLKIRPRRNLVTDIFLPPSLPSRLRLQNLREAPLRILLRHLTNRLLLRHGIRLLALLPLPTSHLTHEHLYLPQSYRSLQLLRVRVKARQSLSCELQILSTSLLSSIWSVSIFDSLSFDPRSLLKTLEVNARQRNLLTSVEVKEVGGKVSLCLDSSLLRESSQGFRL